MKHPRIEERDEGIRCRRRWCAGRRCPSVSVYDVHPFPITSEPMLSTTSRSCMLWNHTTWPVRPALERSPLFIRIRMRGALTPAYAIYIVSSSHMNTF